MSGKSFVPPPPPIPGGPAAGGPTPCSDDSDDEDDGDRPTSSSVVTPPPMPVVPPPPLPPAAPTTEAAPTPPPVPAAPSSPAPPPTTAQPPLPSDGNEQPQPESEAVHDAPPAAGESSLRDEEVEEKSEDEPGDENESDEGKQDGGPAGVSTSTRSLSAASTTADLLGDAVSALAEDVKPDGEGLSVGTPRTPRWSIAGAGPRPAMLLGAAPTTEDGKPLLHLRIMAKQIKGLAAMMAAAGSDLGDKPEKCGVMMWVSDAHGEPLGPIAEWPARKGVSPVWNSARYVVQTMHPAPDCLPVQIRIELLGVLDDGSRVIVAGPAIFAPEALPSIEKPVILQRATHATASKAFNPAPPASLTIRTLPSIPRELVPASQRKLIYLIRHGESKWNEGKRTKNVYKMVREHDHPLNETGYKQALQLQLAIRRALADPPKDGQEPTTAQSLGLAGAFWASPLTRAVQTAITALEPILSQPGNMLELKLNAREKKNFGGLDSIGRVCGNECYKRALGELMGLDQSDGGPSHDQLKALAKLNVNPDEVMQEWWVESGAEDKESLGQRLEELLHQCEHCAADKIVLVGHSHFFREIFRRFLHPAFTHRDPHLLRTLQTKSVPNCSVLSCEVDFSLKPYCIRNVNQVVFGNSAPAAGQVKKDKHLKKLESSMGKAASHVDHVRSSVKGGASRPPGAVRVPSGDLKGGAAGSGGGKKEGGVMGFFKSLGGGGKETHRKSDKMTSDHI